MSSEKNKISNSIIWFSLIYIIPLCLIPGMNTVDPLRTKVNLNKLKSSSGYFDSTITTDNDKYSMFQIIVSEFEFTSVLLGLDYFKFAFASHPYNFSGIIYESDPVIKSGLINDEFIFHINDYNLTLFSENSTFYILLLYYGLGEGMDNIVCCYKDVLIHKENVGFYSNINNTIIEYSENIIFDAFFFSERNESYLLRNHNIFYQIYNDEVPVTEEISIYTDIYGRVDIYFKSSDFKKVGNFIIKISSLETQYFNTLSFELNLLIKTKDLKLVNSENTPKNLIMDKFEESILQYPVWINTVINNFTFYDSEICLNLKSNKFDYEMINLYNGTYVYLLAIENIDVIHQVEIKIESDCFKATTIHLDLNISKRNVIFNQQFPNIVEFSDENPLKLQFQVLDEIDNSNIHGLDENLVILFFNDSICHEISIELISDNVGYFFNITTEILKNITIFGAENLTFLISFCGSRIYNSQNSTINFISSSSYFRNGNVTSPYLIFNPFVLINLFLICAIVSLISYFVSKFYKYRIKIVFHLKKMKI